MASFKLNIARVRQCPAPEALGAAMEEFGLPDGEPFGVLNHSQTSAACFATIARRTQQTVQTLDAESQEVTSAMVEKVTIYPIAIFPRLGTLEIYAGTASGIEQIAGFLGSSLALPTIVDPVEMDIPSAIDKLGGMCERFRLEGVCVRDYAHNSYMAGPYAPKFLDGQHGMDFLNEHVDDVVSARVAFFSQTGKVSVTLSPNASFGFACNEDDETDVQTILRKLV